MADKGLSNIDIVLLALLELGGFEKKIHTEVIAHKAFELDPTRFGWRLPEFRERGYPDKEPVRSALMDAAKAKNGSLVDGRSGVEASGKDADGWMFTPAGAKWIRGKEQLIKQKLGVQVSRLRPTETAHFLRQIKAQPLFARFMEVGNLAGESPFSFTDMLNVSPDSARSVVSRKFQRLRSTAELAGDSDVLSFLDACAQEFSSVLSGNHVQVKK